MEERGVIVVGGGMAGLSAAARLAQANVRVILLGISGNHVNGKCVY
jgi:flavin-dependent dehydrogenase